MSNWAEAVDPKKAELLSMSSTGSNGVLKAIFDSGWRTFRSTTGQENSIYSRFKGSLIDTVSIFNDNA